MTRATKTKPDRRSTSKSALVLDARERRYRNWAARILSDLPPDDEGAKRVLELAEQMRREWLGGAS